MIRIDHVTFSYGEENENAGGVHDINLTVEDGQCAVSYTHLTLPTTPYV